MKKVYKIIFVLVTFFVMGNNFISSENHTNPPILNIGGVTYAHAKVQREWCESGKKNADEFWQINLQTGCWVCTCVSDDEDCCVC